MCLGSVLIPRKLTFLPCTYRKHCLFFPIDYAISYRLFIYGPYCIQVRTIYEKPIANSIINGEKQAMLPVRTRQEC